MVNFINNKVILLLSMELKEEKLSRAISAFSRRQILRLLADTEMTVKDIAESTEMSVSLASRHLKLLYDLGFLNVRKEFPNKFYSLKVKELKNLLELYDKVIKKI
jgi:DNA-binding transcriptional ArsR family regulator